LLGHLVISLTLLHDTAKISQRIILYLLHHHFVFHAEWKDGVRRTGIRSRGHCGNVCRKKDEETGRGSVSSSRGHIADNRNWRIQDRLNDLLHGDTQPSWSGKADQQEFGTLLLGCLNCLLNKL